MIAAPLPSAALVYPFTVGLIATVNPCGFPLLPVYLNFFVGTGDGPGRPPGDRAIRGAVAGALTMAGFVVLFGAIGLLAELGVSAASATAASWSRWLMVACGVAMAAAGILGLFGRPLRLRLPPLPPGLGLRRPVALFVFGLAYGVASLGCALPLFLGGVAGMFTRSGVITGLSSFIAYALGMGFLFTALAIVVAITGPAALKRFRVVTGIVPVVGSALLVVVGAYLIVYWTTALFAPTATSAPVRVVESLQSRLADVLAAHPVASGLMLGAVVVGTLVAYALRQGRHGRAPEREARPS